MVEKDLEDDGEQFWGLARDEMVVSRGRAFRRAGPSGPSGLVVRSRLTGTDSGPPLRQRRTNFADPYLECSELVAVDTRRQPNPTMPTEDAC